MKQRGLILLFLIVCLHTQAQNVLMSWSFESKSQIDTIEGSYSQVPGIKGYGLKLDGYTTKVVRNVENLKFVGDEFSIQSNVALVEYPWNWSPVLTTEGKEVKGYRLMIGPLGQVSFQIAINEQWIVCTSGEKSIPLQQWINIVGTYKSNDKIELFMNGQLVSTVKINGKLTLDKNADCIIGMVASKDKPSNIHRTFGSVAQFYGINGILDEVSIFDKRLKNEQILLGYNNMAGIHADIEPIKLPSIKSSGKFGAYYTKLKYHPSWDNIWRVADDPDVVVCFEKSPVKLVFWRGTRYGASWVTENGNWMTDQSVEAWDDIDGCFEHMQDRHCRFSHVRIIENTPARVVIHWRYAPVSSKDKTWNIDLKTGWECWIDEYYYIYPDAATIRKVSWSTGSLGYPRQFQESLPLNHPGQKMSDLLEQDYAYVSDYNGKLGVEKFMKNTIRTDLYNGYTIQRYNLKSKNKPFICFEPGNNMELRNAAIESYNRYGVCDHFPVGQARCDGRTSIMGDKPTSSMGFPISYPIVHKNDSRSYWCGLYGMNEMDMGQLLLLGRSWAYPAELTNLTSGIVNNGYDYGERCYKLENKLGDTNKQIDFQLNGNKDNPIINPIIYIKNWSNDVEILLNGKKNKKIYSGLKENLDGSDLILFIPYKSSTTTNISIISM